MFWFVGNKRFEDFISHIKEAFKHSKKDIKDNSKQLLDLNTRLAKIEGYLTAQSQKSQSHSQPVSSNIKQSQSNIETKVINRIRRSKKALVMAEIKKLDTSMPVIEIFDIIVKEKGLCSKASFYRYIASLKSQKLIENETN